MKTKTTSLAALAAFTLAGPASAATLLFADNFNESPANDIAATFNDNVAGTQSGSIGTTTYTVSGSGYSTQHSNGGTQMTLATFPSEFGPTFGRVSLNHDFAANANAADQALVFSFTLKNVFGYAGDTSEWVSFTIGSTQMPFVTGGYAGAIFRANGATQSFADGAGVGGTPAWAANDVVTITLSGTGGVGSAFDGGGTVATIQLGANNIGTFTLGQKSAAYLTFSAGGANIFGGGEFDDLSVTLVPEPGAALLGGLGMLALLRRRRR
jgi:MYXO-CTERM domain-containing protein